ARIPPTGAEARDTISSSDHGEGEDTMATKEIIHDSFTIERRYRSPVDKVWNAFADETLKRAWFAEGEGFEVIEYGLDCRLDGRAPAPFSGLEAPVPLVAIGDWTRYFGIRALERRLPASPMSKEGTPFSASLVTVTCGPEENGGTRVPHLEQVVCLDQA